MRLSSWKELGGRTLWLLGLTAALGVAGCSKGAAKVSGVVDLDGKPLKGGDIAFISTEGKPPAHGPIAEDGTGKYSLEKVPTGKVKVVVTTAFLKPPKVTVPGYKPPKDSSATGYTPPGRRDTTKIYTPIPPKYEDEKTTPLTENITGDNDNLPIHLTNK